MTYYVNVEIETHANTENTNYDVRLCVHMERHICTSNVLSTCTNITSEKALLWIRVVVASSSSRMCNLITPDRHTHTRIVIFHLQCI